MKIYKIKQQEMADKLGISRASLNFYLNHSRCPPPHVLERISKVTRCLVSIEEIVKEYNRKNKN